MIRSALALLALPAALAGTGVAQVVSIGPFIGELQEGFSPAAIGGVSTSCVAGGIFQGTATLCTPGATNVYITGGWGGPACHMNARTGGWMFGTVFITARIEFATPVTRFGGYFGNHRLGAIDGSVVMFDSTGATIFSGTYDAPNDCAWYWNGWEVTGGPPIAAIEFLGFNDVGRVLLDDLECSAAPTFLQYCFGDGSGTPCPCLNTGLPGNGCSNSAFAAGAHLAASGVASVSADSLTLRVTQARPSQPGLLFQGEATVLNGNGIAFGDGLRCAGQGVQRLQILGADAAGSATSTVSISAVAGLLAGQTRRYQFWYRDPGASPCGSDFNLSNGVEAVWVP